ncbi:MAG: hypothetical protein WBB47_02090, partial [Paenisporosarcina sp.]|uniref:hypothetical protein n=1 Tax=Paenisporosarcina sp. TaxID=1932001 RepID=UPI003C73D6DC
VENQHSDIIEFIDTVFSGHTDLQSDIKRTLMSHLNKGIFSLQTTGEIQMVACAFESIWHPVCTYIQVAYDFTSSNKAALHELLTYLQTHVERPLLFKIDGRFTQLSSVLIESNYTMIRQTDICSIDVRTVHVEGMMLPDNVLTLHDLMKTPHLHDQFISLCKDVYTNTHLNNPVADLPITAWTNMITADVLEEISSVLVVEDEVRAFSLIYKGDRTDSWELGWNGVRSKEPPFILKEMLEHQIRIGQRHGIHFIEKENDSTDPFSQYVLKDIPHQVIKTLYSYKGR